jgi:hypothetical protein
MPQEDFPRRNAMFISAGDHHRLHKDMGLTRDFDVIIAWYGTDEEVARQLRDKADDFFEIKGGKFQNLRSLWSQGKISLESYESVFVADDDVDLSPEKIELLFRRRQEFDAWILTPAHLRTGRVSYRTLAYRPHWSHHFTNFIEENTPVFETRSLIRFLHEFDGSVAGWGVDHWFMNVLGPDEPNRYVVDHSVTFLNPISRAGGREIDVIGKMKDLRVKWIRVSEEHSLTDIQPVVLTPVRATSWTSAARTLAHLCHTIRHLIENPRSASRYFARLRRRLHRRPENRSR